VDAHFRAIKAGWVFQLNADVNGKLCRKSVDLLAFSVTSIPKRNNTLCLCIIPSTTESQQAYTVVYNELRKAVCLVPSIKPCDDEDIVSCGIITALLADAEVAAYVKSQKCKECILPVQRPCATISRAGAISRRMSWASNQMYASRMRLVTFNSFVLSHVTGNVQLLCVSGIASANRSHVKQFPDVAAYDDYYDIVTVVDTGEIGVDLFATQVQSLVV
jgi:hypothetical protein